MKNEMFCAYSRYYDLLYHDKDYAGEAVYINDLLKKHDIINGDILEFGSGTGKHGRILASQGHQIHGIELSSEMVANADLVPGFTCQQGDISCTTMCKKYDAVISLFHVMSYQTSNDRLNAVFANAALHLNSNGLFIFDFWYSPAVYTQKPVVRVKRIADTDVDITRIAEPVNYFNENRVDVNYTIYVRESASGLIQSFQETHPMRHFSLPEIDIIAAQHGFKRVDAEEFLTKETPNEATWGVCVILKKI